MTSTLRLAMLRIVEMEKQAFSELTPPVPADAVPFFPYEQEAFPYVVNWWQGVEPKDSLDDLDSDLSEDIEVEWHTILARVVNDHLTSGFKGERALELYDFIPALTQFFRVHPYLTSTAYPDPLDGIGPIETAITTGTGLRVFSNVGISAQQIGSDLTLRLPIIIKVY